MKMHYVGKLLFEIILSVCALKLREYKWAISGKKSCKQTSRTKGKLFHCVKFLHFVIEEFTLIVASWVKSEQDGGK